MEEKFVKYLGSIGMTTLISQRVETIYKFYGKALKKEITDIIVSDYLNQDGTREYDNLLLFSEKCIMEAKRFIIEDDFDIAPFKSRVKYWNIKKKDYDFEKATEKSRLNLDFSLDTGIACTIKASKENCDYLRDIFYKYIEPNLME